jgi:hypothetical protein
MNIKKILMWCGLGAGCVSLLSGCAGLVDSLSTPITPQEVSLESGLQSKLQKKKMALTNDVEIAEYQAVIADAIRKDCQARGSEFTPAPSTGLATNRVSIPTKLNHLMLTENERTKVLGIIDRGYRYVLLPEYLYFCDNGSVPAKILKVPYSCMYDFSEIGKIAKDIQGRDDVERVLASNLLLLKHDREVAKVLSWDGETILAVPTALAPLRAEFKNVYAANTKYIQSLVDDALAKNNAVEAAKKAKKDAELAAKKAKEDAELAAKQEQAKLAKQVILAWDDAPAKARAEAMKNKTIVFKSLYLGMPIEDAHHLLYRALGVANDDASIGMNPAVLSMDEATGLISQACPQAVLAAAGAAMSGQTDTVVDETVLFMLKAKDGNLYVPLVVADFLTAVIGGFVEATPDGKVIKIMLGKKAVDILFSAEKMDASAFADQFVKYYNIPRMDASADWRSWVYLRDDGVKLSISDEKVLLLERATGQKTLKKSFD